MLSNSNANNYSLATAKNNCKAKTVTPVMVIDLLPFIFTALNFKRHIKGATPLIFYHLQSFSFGTTAPIAGRKMTNNHTLTHPPLNHSL